jgi:hypothetical protein
VSGDDEFSDSTGTDHMIPETVVVRAAGRWRRRGDVYHHERITNLGSPARKLNDIRAVEVAYTKVRNVPAHSRVINCVVPKNIQCE